MSESYRDRDEGRNARDRSPDRGESSGWRSAVSRAAGSALRAVGTRAREVAGTIADPEFRARAAAQVWTKATEAAGHVTTAARAGHAFVTDPAVQARVVGAAGATLGAGIAIADFFSPYKTLTLDATVNTPPPAVPAAQGAGAGGAQPAPAAEMYTYVKLGRYTKYKVGQVFGSTPFVPNEPFEIFNGPHAYRWLLNNHIFNEDGTNGRRFDNYALFLNIQTRLTPPRTFQDQIRERASVFWDGVKVLNSLQPRMIAIETNNPLIQQIIDPIAGTPFQAGDFVIFAACFDYPNPTAGASGGRVSLDRSCLNLTAQKERDGIPLEASSGDSIKTNFLNWICMPNNVKYKLYVVKIIAPKPSASFGKPVGLTSFVRKYKKKHPRTPHHKIVAKYHKAIRNLQAHL